MNRLLKDRLVFLKKPNLLGFDKTCQALTTINAAYRHQKLVRKGSIDQASPKGLVGHVVFSHRGITLGAFTLKDVKPHFYDCFCPHLS